MGHQPTVIEREQAALISKLTIENSKLLAELTEARQQLESVLGGIHSIYHRTRDEQEHVRRLLKNGTPRNIVRG